MLLVSLCFGIRSERRLFEERPLFEEMHLNLAYRRFCRLVLTDRIPDHSTFSKNRHGRFRDSELLRHLFVMIPCPETENCRENSTNKLPQK